MTRYFCRAIVIRSYQKLCTSGLSLSLSSEDNNDVSVVLLFFRHVFDADLKNKIF
jgi:hypothetical protein